MLDRSLGLLFAALLIIFFLPLLAWYFIRAKLDFGRPGSNRAEPYKTDLLKQQIARQFRFEHAIEAYEELIDSTFAEGRQ